MARPTYAGRVSSPPIAPPGVPARPRGRAGPRGVALLGAAAVLATALAVAWAGAARAPVLGDPGAVVRWGLPVSSVLTELTGAVTLGALVLAGAVLPWAGRPGPARARQPEPAGPLDALGRAWPTSLRVAGWAAAAWTLLALVHLLLTYANVAGRPWSAVLGGDELGVFVTQVSLGRILLAGVVVAAVVTVLALVVRTPTGVAWTALLVVVALWQQAQTGHAAGTTSHDLATSAMALHLVSAAVWVGGLAALVVLARSLGPDAAPAVARYSLVAGWCLVGVGVSGLLNAVVRLGGWAGFGTAWGRLVVAKALLFGLLGLLGWLHRRHTVRALAAGGGASLFWRLALVELAVMGAVSGVAVALGSTAPPDPGQVPLDRTPAYLVTGHPLPPELTGARWFTEWRPDVLMACAAVAGLVVYLRWVRRLHRRGDRWPALRTVSWVTGMVVFGWTTSGGPAVYGHVLFSAHMVQHMVLVMVVPIFVVLAAPVTLALRALPARPATLRGDASRGPREWLLVLVHSRWGRFLAHPIVAAVNFAGSMIAFYYTDVFGWALADPVGHLVMVLHFSLAGYLFANALVGVDPGPSRPAYPMRLLLLFATMGFHAFFGVTLMSGDALLVADWFGLLGRPWGPSAIRDQQLGGSIAWGIGELPTLALAIAVAVAWSRDDERVARRRDRRVDRDGDREMDEYNAMLARLSEHET